MQKKFISMAEVAQRYGLSYKAIQKLVAEGELPAIRFHRLVRIPLEALEQWEQEQLAGRPVSQ